MESHLLQMRGLKHTDTLHLVYLDGSHLLQMRGLKHRLSEYDFYREWSHLLQMRGLKHVRILPDIRSTTSHLLQMRGLKLLIDLDQVPFQLVASFTDAWIETESNGKRRNGLRSRIFYRCVD